MLPLQITNSCTMQITEKPELLIQTLINRLEMKAKYVPRPRRITLTYEDSGECILLHKGYVTIVRSNDTLILNTESAPFIFGLGASSLPYMDYYLRTSEGAILSTISRTEAMAMIKKENLWQDYTLFLSYVFNRIFNHCIRISQQTSYETIKVLLNELMAESDELRLSTTIASYIQERSIISRSGILNILAVLRASGLIETEDGILKAIKKLPAKY